MIYAASTPRNNKNHTSLSFNLLPLTKHHPELYKKLESGVSILPEKGSCTSTVVCPKTRVPKKYKVSYNSGFIFFPIT